MSNYVIVCCNYYSLGVAGQKPNQELDKFKKLKLITPVIYAIIEWTVDTVKLLNNVVVGNGKTMSKEHDRRLDGYTHLIEKGEWQTAIKAMASDGHDYAGIKACMYAINFYPDAEQLEYAQTVLHNRENSKVLDNFFGFN